MVVVLKPPHRSANLLLVTETDQRGQ